MVHCLVRDSPWQVLKHSQGGDSVAYVFVKFVVNISRTGLCFLRGGWGGSRNTVIRPLHRRAFLVLVHFMFLCFFFGPEKSVSDKSAPDFRFVQGEPPCT